MESECLVVLEEQEARAMSSQVSRLKREITWMEDAINNERVKLLESDWYDKFCRDPKTSVEDLCRDTMALLL